MCDIIGYARTIEVEDKGTQVYLFMRGTPRFEAGSRFKYIDNQIEFNYNNLVNAIDRAIDKQAKEDGDQYITEERENLYSKSTEINFDDLMNKFQEITQSMINKNASHYAPIITEIVERHLGKGKKVAECSRDQAILLDIIIAELSEIK